jgi:UDP-2,3-diacylglucosamine hydrolase
MTTAGKAQSESVALFVSDVHLQPGLPRTTRAFMDFLCRHAPHARQLYLLGDMFEYWAGDDDRGDPYNAAVIDALRAVSDSGVEVFWIAGNRDFLVGPAFAQAAGLQLLEEPHLIHLAGRDIVLVHGDAQCTDDAGYMAFRAQVRQTQWQTEFLALPLAQRKAIIEGMRSGSREAQRDKPYTDVNPQAIDSLFESSGASVMIHGHTHRPAMHSHRDGICVRHVLPDWDCDNDSPRGGWLALLADGSIRRFNVAGLAQE